MKIEQLENIIYGKLESDSQQIEISFNNPKSYYETVADLVKDRPEAQWTSVEDKAEAIKTNTVWEISLYDSAKEDNPGSLHGISFKPLIAQYFGLDIEDLDAVDQLETKLKSLLNENGILHVTYSRVLEEYSNISPDCISKEDGESAVKNKTICELQVYPRTPIGSYLLMSDSLEKCVDFAMAD
jgi:hypothetical protein